MISVVEIRKTFGSLVAVDGLSFQVEAGETYGLLGPNGAGKTTTMNMLTGLSMPDAGAIRLGGFVDPTRPEVRRQLGLCPQALSLYGQLTAEENLRFFGKLYDLRGPVLRSRVEEALAVAGLADRRRDRVATFSGGMQRRLNLACALLHEPPVLLLDEPTVGVDPQSRAHLLDALDRLKAGGRTIVYTTHHMEEAERLCDRVGIVDHGRLLAEGRVDDLKSQHGGPATVTAEFAHPPSSPPLDLPGEWRGPRFLATSAEPLSLVGRLASLGVLRELRIEQPDLERVFLNLTGRRLRDA